MTHNESARITVDDARHVAKLSRLNLSDDELERIAGQLSRVLEYVETLQQLDVENVEPMAHAGDFTNVLREDQEQPGLPIEDAMRNAPDSDPPYFKTTKVLGDGGGA